MHTLKIIGVMDAIQRQWLPSVSQTAQWPEIKKTNRRH
jgi:hypothetical protein